MGLIKAGMGAVGGVLADQWKEFFYCQMAPDILMMKGQKRTGSRSSNQGDDNIISNGSRIAVNSWGNGSPSAGIPVRISGYTISIPRN